MRTLDFIVPEGIDDPGTPSGGNLYDRRVCQGLASLGWMVHEHAVTGQWPTPDSRALTALAGVVERIGDGRVVLADGLVACSAPEVLVAHAHRLRLVVLVHMPLGHRPANGGAPEVRSREGAVLGSAASVVTTSAWSRDRLLGLYPLPPARVHIATPGVDAAAPAPGTRDGGRLLCVAAVAFDKGHDVLVDALANIADLSWECACVGSLERDPEFVAHLHERTQDDRVSFRGAHARSALHGAYAGADLLVLPSRAETYGMVITEALARGLPVVAADIGGVSEALGYGAGAARPGLLVAPEDASALAAALRAWLSDGALRARLRRAAHERRWGLAGWEHTALTLAGVLAGASP